jgi:hypothetical protein
VPVLTSLRRHRARFISRRPSSPFGIRHGHHFAVIHGLHGAPVPIAYRPSARQACRLLRARLRMRCPGSGPSVRSSGSGCGPSHRCRRGSPLVSLSRPPVARVPSPSEPARGEPVDRRDFCCCRADREGSGSPFTPHRVAARAWNGARSLPLRGEKTWSPGNGGGTGWDRSPGSDHSDRQGLEPNDEASGEGGGQREILWRQATALGAARTRLRRPTEPLAEPQIEPESGQAAARFVDSLTGHEDVEPPDLGLGTRPSRNRTLLARAHPRRAAAPTGGASSRMMGGRTEAGQGFWCHHRHGRARETGRALPRRRSIPGETDYEWAVIRHFMNSSPSPRRGSR